MATINERFKKVIELKAGSQINYAREIGVHAQSINAYCNNKGIGINPILRLLQQYPDVNANYILTGIGTPIIQKESELEPLRIEIEILRKEIEILINKIADLKLI